MNKIEISIEQFLRFPSIKPGIVHRHKNMVYKYSPNSLEIVVAIEAYRKEEVLKHISIPKAYLFSKKTYFGYTMEYYKKLKNINSALDLGIIKDVEVYALELLEIIKKLNSLNLCYWDFHNSNILSDEFGHPFIIDIDDINYIPTHEDLHYQRQFLTEFLLNLYLKKAKNTIGYYKDESIQKYFTPNTLKYLDNLGNLGLDVPDLPYCIIEELTDKEKTDMIKSKII